MPYSHDNCANILIVKSTFAEILFCTDIYERKSCHIVSKIINGKVVLSVYLLL